MLKKITIIALLASFSFLSQASLIGYADVVLEYSGQTPPKGELGAGGFRDFINDQEIADAVTGDDGSSYLSLPTGSFVILGFTDETVIDGVGNDIFVSEVGSANESADIFVTSNMIDYVFLGTANNSNGVSSFDLASISFTEAVQGIKIVGNDTRGSSPGFDLSFVQVLPGSIGAAPTPPISNVSAPATVALFTLALGGLVSLRRNK